ncbi:MAG: efflux RND transporter permease subunit [Pseudomonadaceae bacterium]|nr:efflux RND transporter permease subunit [Pseudomonadaceae bacterium]
MNGPIEWFARNHIAANLLLCLIVMAGLVSLPSMQQKSFPDLEFNLITVSVLYLGAAPEEVEEGVCVRIEEALEGISGVEKISSTATEGVCSVSVELYEDADETKALGDVKNRVDAIDTFPVETEKPIITYVTSERGVMDIAVTGPVDEAELKVVGQQVRDDIAALRGVTQVTLGNSRPYEISVEISETSLRRHGLTFQQVANAVRAGSLDLPGGSIKTAGGEILLRTKGQAYRGPEFEELVVLTKPDGSRVYLKDLATVVDGFEETDQKLWFNGRPAALIRVARTPDQDILDITAAINEYLATGTDHLPEGVELTVWSDGSEFLRDRLDTLFDSARQGFLLVLLLLALFLRPRLSFWVSVGVPVAFMGAIFLTSLLGLSIDGISTFGFILVLGILVDDAVVVGERVYSLQYRSGAHPTDEHLLNAAIAGTRQVSVPVIFGVLTTATAFIPVMLGPGTIGQIQSVIATVVLCCLAFSLVESQLVLPSHLGHKSVSSASGEVSLMLTPLLAIVLWEISWSGRSFAALAIGVASVFVAWHLSGGFEKFAEATIRQQQRFSDVLENFIQNTFRSVVTRAIRARYVTVASAVAVFIATIGALMGGHMPFSFFPSIAADAVTVKLTMPLGTPARVTEDILLNIQQAGERLSQDLAAEYPQAPPVTHILSALGGQPVSNSGGGIFAGGTAPSGGHLAEVTLQLVPGAQREVGTLEIAQRWRESVGVVPDVEELSFNASSFSTGAEIDIQLEGPDLDELSIVAKKLRERLGEYPGVIDIADSFRAGKQEIQLEILPAGEALGLNLAMLASQVRQAFYGEEIQRIQRGRDDVRVMLRYTESERRNLSALDSMRIRTADGSQVPFATVAKATLGTGFSAIKRIDGRRVVNVTADVDRTMITANEILAEFGAGPAQDILQDHPRVSYSLEGTQREQGDTAASLVPLFILALFVIYALLAIPLGSYGQPLIIMSVIPFAFVGAVWGHIIMKSVGLLDSMAIMSIMGSVAASGVVINSSLVLVHAVNNRRRDGMEMLDAVTDAAVTRCRPILLTSLTTFAGLTPLLLNQSVQAGVLVPMATSVAWGVALATVVTLLVVPASYVIREDIVGKRMMRKTLVQDSAS